MALMGYREYARHHGCTLAAVQKAIRTGRIVVTPGGRIDSEDADRRWAETTNPAKAPAASVAVAVPMVMPLIDGEAGQAPAMRRPQWPEWDGWKPAPPPERTGVAPVIAMDSYLAAKTERERAEAELAKIELAEKRGELVRAAEVKQGFQSIGKMYAASREGIPGDLAVKLIGKTDLAEVERLIRTELREADKRVANDIQTRFADLVTDVRYGSVAR